MSEAPKEPKLNRRLVMQRYPIDGQAIKRLTSAGMTWLDANKQMVNALNVFPVPDGDTGTNMVLTMQSAFDEIENSPERHAGKMLGAVAQGALMGARGNSGVILSQIWRGFAHALRNEESLSAETLARAFANARDTAYKGVVRPVEGTMLTVIKDVAAAADEGVRRGLTRSHLEESWPGTRKSRSLSSPPRRTATGIRSRTTSCPGGSSAESGSRSSTSTTSPSSARA